MKKIFAICGSTRADSANLRLLHTIAHLTSDRFEVDIFEGLAQLPHFNPDQSLENPPPAVVAFRQKIADADGVLICTPEYVFSMPGSLKNALEWTVATVVFSGKPTGLITASASGKKGHAELKLVMKTLGARFRPKNSLLISGIKGKMDAAGNFKDENTRLAVEQFVADWKV